MGMKFYEYQGVINELSLSFSIAGLLTTQATWKKLAEGQREIILRSATEATAWQRKELQRMNESCKEQILTYGVKILPLEQQPLEAWKLSAKPLYDSFSFPGLLCDIIQAKNKYHEQRVH
jgi:TRAP-type C4-dicarboxylate transport system substrate-binding protein